MKIAIIGFGKMGKAIESIALKRGHQIILKIDHQNLEELSIEKLQECEVAIEFTNPDSVYNNIKTCLKAQIPIVVGTTAWLDNLNEIKNEVLSNNLSFVWASNFSLGANLFFKLNNQLAELMNNFVNDSQYDVQIEEIHHTQKIDAPSGTAITIANDILYKLKNKTAINTLGINQKSILNELVTKSFNDKIDINALRLDDVPGTHLVTYFSKEDTINIEHKAINRDGFALGAIIAAEKIINTKGFYEFRELLF